MKFFKRLVKLSLVVLLLVVVLAAVGFVRSRQQPEWYAQIRAYDPGEAAAAAKRADDKFQSTWAWVSARQAAEARARQGDTRPPLTPVPAAVFSVTFTEQELNAAFEKWKGELKWEQTYAAYVSNPVIAIRDGKIILAGTVKDLGRVVSFHFRPGIDKQSGRLSVELESVMAGKLPVPQAAFDRYRQGLAQHVGAELPEARADAKMRPDGSVNDNAQKAMMGQLILAVLQRKTVEPVLLTTGNQPQPGQAPRLVPVRLVDFAVKEETIMLAVEMMTLAEREAWLQRLRGGGASE
jgi:hypothetical protein